MRFYKEVWGIIWEFNSIGEYVSFCIGRLLGVIIFFGGMYLLVECDNSDTTTEKSTYDYEVKDASYYRYQYDEEE
jgi:NADH:ubiquinone oxidoreductase subunit H